MSRWCLCSAEEGTGQIRRSEPAPGEFRTYETGAGAVKGDPQASDAMTNGVRRIRLLLAPWNKGDCCLGGGALQRLSAGVGHSLIASAEHSITTVSG